MIGAAFGLGFIIGPVLGGWLGGIDLRWPFWAAACLALCNFSYGWFVLPESLPPDRRTSRFDWAHANPLGSLVLLRRYPQVFGLAAVVLLINLAHYVYPSVFVLYADYRYGWGPQAVGWVLARGRRASAWSCNAVLVKRVVAAIGERRTLLRRPGLRRRRLRDLRLGADRAAWFLVGIPIMRDLGAVDAGDAGADHAPGRRRRAGPHPGRVEQPGEPGRHHRPAALSPAVFALFISSRAPVHLPGAPFLLALRDAGGRGRGGLAGGARTAAGHDAPRPTAE